MHLCCAGQAAGQIRCPHLKTAPASRPQETQPRAEVLGSIRRFHCRRQIIVVDDAVSPAEFVCAGCGPGLLTEVRVILRNCARAATTRCSGALQFQGAEHNAYRTRLRRNSGIQKRASASNSMERSKKREKKGQTFVTDLGPKVKGRASTKWRRNGCARPSSLEPVYNRPCERNRLTGSNTGTASRRKIQRATAKPIAA